MFENMIPFQEGDTIISTCFQSICISNDKIVEKYQSDFISFNVEKTNTHIKLTENSNLNQLTVTIKNGMYVYNKEHNFLNITEIDESGNNKISIFILNNLTIKKMEE